MKNISIQNVLYLALMFIMASCVAPQPVIRVIPTETKTTWQQGKEFVSYQKNDFIIHCAYHGTDARYLIFDVEIVNGSQSEFLVAPENIIMYTDSGKWDPVTNQIVYATFPIRAADPEFQLLKLDMQESIAEANMKNQQTAAVVASVAALPIIVAAASADINDKKPRAVTRTDVAATATVGVLNGIEISQVENEINYNNINYKRETWNQYALRKTTLSPGESTRGLIYFKKPLLEKYRDLRIDAPISNDDFIKFNYRVIIYYPQPNTVQ